MGYYNTTDIWLFWRCKPILDAIVDQRQSVPLNLFPPKTKSPPRRCAEGDAGSDKKPGPQRLAAAAKQAEQTKSANQSG